MADDEYGLSEDRPFRMRIKNASKLAWIVGAVLAVIVVAWWWSVYSHTDSNQSIGAHLVVVLAYGTPMWFIFFGAFLGIRAAVRSIRHRS